MAGALGRGVLHQERAASRFGLTRCPPSAALAPFVDFYWILRWDLRGQSPHEQTLLPHPNVNLAFEQAGAAIYGVEQRLFTRQIEGRGTVLGVRFPGRRLPPVLGRSRRGAQQPHGPRGAAVRPGRRQRRRGGPSWPLGMTRRWWRGPSRCSGRSCPLAIRSPSRSPRWSPGSPGIPRCAGWASSRPPWGCRCNSYKRLFAEYVGVSPKWVMRRARLQEAAMRAEQGGDVDWAAVAAGPRLRRSGAPHPRLHDDDRCSTGPLCHIHRNSTAYA